MPGTDIGQGYQAIVFPAEVRRNPLMQCSHEVKSGTEKEHSAPAGPRRAEQSQVPHAVLQVGQTANLSKDSRKTHHGRVRLCGLHDAGSSHRTCGMVVDATRDDDMMGAAGSVSEAPCMISRTATKLPGVFEAAGRKADGAQRRYLLHHLLRSVLTRLATRLAVEWLRGHSEGLRGCRIEGSEGWRGREVEGSRGVEGLRGRGVEGWRGGGFRVSSSREVETVQ
eukprot:3209197-Rhodomonas_salina.1